MEHLEHLLQNRIYFLLSSALTALFNKHLHHTVITSCHGDHYEVSDQFSPCAVGLMPALIPSQFSLFQQRKGWVAAEKL